MNHPRWMPEDKLRKEKGWRGEWGLFRSAQAQHSVKHPIAEINCKVCEVIYRNINRLAAEGDQMEAYVKGIRK